jgi:hypothetical protein
LTVIAVIGVVVGGMAALGPIASPLTLVSLLLLLQQAVGSFRSAVAYRITRRVDGRVRARVMELANGVAQHRPVRVTGVRRAARRRPRPTPT